MTDIQPIEIDGEHWITISMDGCELEKRGPFDSAEAAEVMAAQFGAICRGVLRQPVRIGVVRQAATKQTGSTTGTPESCHGRS